MPAITSENIIGRAVVAVREHAAVRDQPLLLALLEYAPNEKGKLNIANKILHCGDTYTEPEEQDCWGHMPQLSDFFWRHIVIPVRVTGGKTPEPRTRVSRSGVSSAGAFRSPAEMAAVNDLKDLIESASTRDRHRCVISGKVDPEVIASRPGALSRGGTGFEMTRVTHIIPFSLRDSTATTSAGHLPAIWGALECFGGTSLSTLMHGGINALDNVITLSATLHRYFTELQVGLEPVPDAPHTYRVRTWGKVAPRLGLPKTVKLSTASGVPLPNPAYLALHCAICRVLWSSARAEELKEVLEDLEEVTLLAPDGSSANLINMAIYRSLAMES
ncbi:hypothetical protein K466DRAFT_604815 [Polyporus arcularius HHB13444]|uniref:HNH nuclease domain-containing protein n=1 Tax=Polyporus arcularius HHB13444 TaxID=1314778 RepID=A0A5C3NWZ8_9APHY|nr:hypothetical protein K466DRAFT_604815 [Polyporus arcularius HHB13444]